MNNDEYVNLLDLHTNYINEHHDTHTNGNPAYQIQPEPKSNRAVIMEVGRLAKRTDIMMNQFDIMTKGRCIMTSSVYHLDDLRKLEQDCKFPLIKIFVNYNDGDKLNPVGCMILFFHTFIHIKEKRGIHEYVSNKDNKIWLDGLFSISFHFGDKKVVLENIKDNPGMMVMIDKMIMYLASDEILGLIGRLFEEI